jgi:hypothetical protein
MLRARPLGLASIALLTALPGAPPASAGDLLPPSRLENTWVLPERVGTSRLSAFSMSMDSRFNGAGEAAPLAASMNRSLTWQDLAGAQPGPAQRAAVMNAGASTGDTGPGRSTAEVNALASVFLPSLSYGLSEDYTLNLEVPVVRLEVSVDTGFMKNAAGAAYVAALSSQSPMEGERARQQLNDPVNSLAAAYGYRPAQSTTVTALGDAQLGGKLRFLSDPENQLALRHYLTLPTGRAPDADELVDLSTGDGQWDATAALVYEHRLAGSAPEITLEGHGRFTYQLADRAVRRIPTADGALLSPDKESVRRKLGNQVGIGSTVKYDSAATGFSVAAGYEFQHQGATSYAGSAYAAERYRLLEAREPDQALHTGLLSVGYSSVPAYRRGATRAPYEAVLLYTRALAGTHARIGDTLGAELVVFF